MAKKEIPTSVQILTVQAMADGNLCYNLTGVVEDLPDIIFGLAAHYARYYTANGRRVCEAEVEIHKTVNEAMARVMDEIENGGLK